MTIGASPEPKGWTVGASAKRTGKHLSSKALALWQTYTRREAHGILDPGTTFIPQTGTWGLQDIVPIAASPGDLAFFVTFGTTQGDHDFEEEISEDGVLTWQSQPKQRLSAPQIRRLIAHDPLVDTIYLFLRTKKNEPYTYFGRLGYLDHDPNKEQPVHFTWQLLDWPPSQAVLDGLGIVTTVSADPVQVDPPENGLTETEPPSTGSGGNGGPGGHATLPGSDAKKRAVGLAGELLVIAHEKHRLVQAGRPDLAEKVSHVAVVVGDSAGYDVLSFNVDDSERHIEVKTTSGPASNAFYISPNEIRFSEANPDTYVLMRLRGYNKASNSASFYQVTGRVTASFGLTPSEYRAKLSPPT